jgi:hypothetical protein
VPPDNEVIIEARDQADEFERENEKFKGWAEWLKTQAGQPDYYTKWGQFWTQYGDFQRRVDTYAEEVIPDMEDELLPSERPALAKQLGRIQSFSNEHGSPGLWMFGMPTPPEAEEKMRQAAAQQP